VVDRLNDDGLVTVTPTLGLDSLAGDVAIVQQTLDEIPGKKVLVGHSYGGEVITDAAFGRSSCPSCTQQPSPRTRVSLSRALALDIALRPRYLISSSAEPHLPHRA
jgi:hypothetical protein